MQIPIYVDPETTRLVNSRLPRDIKVAILGRWLLRACVMTTEELSKVISENSEEGALYVPVLKSALLKLYTLEPGPARINES